MLKSGQRGLDAKRQINMEKEGIGWRTECKCTCTGHLQWVDRGGAARWGDGRLWRQCEAVWGTSGTTLVDRQTRLGG